MVPNLVNFFVRDVFILVLRRCLPGPILVMLGPLTKPPVSGPVHRLTLPATVPSFLTTATSRESFLPVAVPADSSIFFDRN